jgi:hypothetical protein
VTGAVPTSAVVELQGSKRVKKFAVVVSIHLKPGSVLEHAADEVWSLVRDFNNYPRAARAWAFMRTPKSIAT